jgi:hypothetical protein
MDQNRANIFATDLLKHVIEHQPDLLSYATSFSTPDGAEVAKFCIDFIKTYSAELMKQG